MPFHLAPLPRREFLRRSLLSAAGVLTLPALHAESAKTDPHRFALLSDPHIDADATKIFREVDLAGHLRAAISGVQALPSRPAGVLVNGDCARDVGLAGDYQTFHDLLGPAIRDQFPIHLLLGNHDDRDVFWNTLQENRPAAPLVASKHVSVVKGERANWFLLDSLDVTKQTPGLLGAAQRTWLAQALDQYADKPALVMLHHNPVSNNPAKNSGLIDSLELLSIVLPRRHVKAVFFGHTHTWRCTQQEGLHLVNLPAVAYAFAPTEVTGWIDCQLSASGATLELHSPTERPADCTSAAPKQELAWRA